MSTDADDQRDELDVLRSIYGDDETFKVIDEHTMQFKYGEDGTQRSFVLQVVWPTDYPSTSGPQLSLDAFYNSHLLSEVKTTILAKLDETKTECEGMAATFTIAEFCKDNFETLIADQPLKLAKPSAAPAKNDGDSDDEEEEDSFDDGTVKSRQALSKTQKRRMWDRAVGGTTDDRERGFNWTNPPLIQAMVLHLIGLGLGDVDDITVRGLRVVKQCTSVYLEAYTSILCGGPSKEKLEEFYGRPVILADRDLVEQGVDKLLDEATDHDVALLVVGDPFGATTHADLVLRAAERRIRVNVIHNASIVNAVGCTGLQLYNFGEIISICFWTDGWQPDSYVDKLTENVKRGLHTLCLLDIKVKEQSVENLMKGRAIYEPPRYMTAADAAKQLVTVAERRRDDGKDAGYDSSTMCVAVARLGWPDDQGDSVIGQPSTASTLIGQKIVACRLGEMTEVDMGAPLHSLILCGKLHDLEKEMLKLYAGK